MEFTCDVPTPIPNDEVTPAVHDLTTMDYVNQSKYKLDYEITSANFNFNANETKLILCQQKITSVNFSPEIWMPFGFDNYPYSVYFLQVLYVC